MNFAKNLLETSQAIRETTTTTTAAAATAAAAATTTTTTNKRASTKMSDSKQAREQLAESQSHQHQDLIRLLAQHFNNQFYQMANQHQRQQQHTPASCESSAPAAEGNFQHAPMGPVPQFQHQFRASHEVGMNFAASGGLLPSLDAAPGVGQIPRSHHQHPASSGTSGQAHGQLQQQQHLQHTQHGLPQASNPLACSPLLGAGGLNLFGALNCFNVSSDQFLLSIQQQYLLQAATTAAAAAAAAANANANANANATRQTENPRHTSTAAGPTQAPAQASASTTNSANLNNGGGRERLEQAHGRRTMQGNTGAQGATTDGQGGGDLLKFSISTILGHRRSPTADEAKDCSAGHPSALAIGRYFASQQQDRFAVSTSKQQPGGHHLGGGNYRLGAPGAPAGEPETNEADLTESGGSSLAATPQPSASRLHDMSIKAISTNNGNSTSTSNNNNNINSNDNSISSNNNSGLLLDGSRRVGCLMGLADQHNHNASGSMDNQRPSSSDPLIVDSGSGVGGQQHSSGHHQTALSFLSGSTTFPWTVAARGKPRRGMMRRAVFSDSQRVGLEKRFQLQKYISKPDRKKLAEKLGLRDSQVKIWFQNRRMKWRNSKERELLSAGGSREQTLPTRNNPNPDLSDVGETIKRLVTTSNGVGVA